MIGRIDLKDRIIGVEQKPFIIAEMSGNHNQSLERALAIVKAAADAKADFDILNVFSINHNCL